MPDIPRIVTARPPRRSRASKASGPDIPQRIVVQPSRHERATRREAERVPDPEVEARVAEFFARMTRPVGSGEE